MIEFFQTVMGRMFFEGTMPKLVKALERIGDLLEKHYDATCAVESKELEPSAALSNWDRDDIQFPRLIEELRAAGAFTQDILVDDVCRSMDISHGRLHELLRRADRAWKKAKEELSRD